MTDLIDNAHDALNERYPGFDPFYTTKDRSIGAGNIGRGLGLFVSYAVMQEHGGMLSFESDPGNGTRLHMDLPVATAAWIRGVESEREDIE